MNITCHPTLEYIGGFIIPNFVSLVQVAGYDVCRNPYSTNQAKFSIPLIIKTWLNQL